MAAVSQKEQAAREKALRTKRAEERSEITTRLFFKIPRFVWREAGTELGISKTDADDDDLMIVMAKTVNKELSWQELDQMSPLEIQAVLFGSELAPTEDELLAAVEEAQKAK